MLHDVYFQSVGVLLSVARVFREKSCQTYHSGDLLSKTLGKVSLLLCYMAQKKESHIQATRQLNKTLKQIKASHRNSVHNFSNGPKNSISVNNLCIRNHLFVEYETSI